MKEKKHTFLKILLALILLLIIGRCTQKGFIINVKAESPSLYFHVPNSDDLKNYENKIFTNFAYDNTNLVENIPVSLTNYYQDRVRVNYLDNDTFNVLRQPQQFYSTLGVNFPITKYSSSVSQSLFIDRIQYGSISNDTQTLEYFELKKGYDYELMFELEKDNSTYVRKNLQTDDVNFDISLTNKNVSGYYFDNKVLDINFKNFIVYDDIRGDDKNYSYLLVRFKLKDEITSNESTDYSYYNRVNSLYFQNASFYTSFVNNVDRKSFFHKIIYENNDNVPQVKINKVIFLENGHTTFTPAESNNQDLDNVSMNDMIIFGDLKECDLTDISCHFDNLNTMIKNLFVRIGNGINNIINGITNLFVPDFKKLEDTITTNNQVLTQKLGFIMYPFNLFIDICNRFMSIDIINPQDVVINIEEVRDPFYHQVIIQPGTWNLGQVIQTEPISSLYTIYRAFISVYICYLFICLCYDAFSSFIAGDGGIVSSWTNEIIKDYGYVEDDNPLRRR